jgi:hypothetical protein
MTKDMFQELHMRVRLARKEAIGPFARVSLFTPYLKLISNNKSYFKSSF